MRSGRDFFRKFFLAGQHTVHDEHEEDDSHHPDSLSEFVARHRKSLIFKKKSFKKISCVIIPFVFVYTLYWTLALRHGFYRNISDHSEIAVLMIFGGIVGGATAEGGGAVAFPVLTLLLHVGAMVARDFSALTQCVGLGSATFSIFFMGVVVERRTILFVSLGGVVGTIASLELLDRQLSADVKKMCFVSVFFSFAIALFILNLEKKRKTYRRIQHFCWRDGAGLLVVGVIGGVFGGMAGTGLEVFAFSVIALYYRISEKVATPTTVTLAAINSMVIVFWRLFMQRTVQEEAFEYFAVSAPVVALIAPIGALLSSYVHRKTLAVFIYVLETVTLVTALIVIRPGVQLLALSSAIIGCSLLGYLTIARIGRRRMERMEKRAKQQAKTSKMLFINGQQHATLKDHDAGLSTPLLAFQPRTSITIPTRRSSMPLLWRTKSLLPSDAL